MVLHTEEKGDDSWFVRKMRTVRHIYMAEPFFLQITHRSTKISFFIHLTELQIEIVHIAA